MDINMDLYVMGCLLSGGMYAGKMISSDRNVDFKSIMGLFYHIFLSWASIGIRIGMYIHRELDDKGKKPSNLDEYDYKESYRKCLAKMMGDSYMQQLLRDKWEKDKNMVPHIDPRIENDREKLEERINEIICNRINPVMYTILHSHADDTIPKWTEHKLINENSIVLSKFSKGTGVELLFKDGSKELYVLD